jgi:16S rRNA (guanine527-N7)-methyltransferase
MGSAEALMQILFELECDFNDEIAQNLLKYVELLGKWNLHINLTASTKWEAMEPLFKEAIWASKSYPAEAIAHLDIGSGAGFPAAILKILIPRLKMEMIESRNKKGAFLETAIFKLNLQKTWVHSERLDSFLRYIDPGQQWDCISWKALKLKDDELLLLREHVHANTQFWMFHGNEPAVKQPQIMGRYFRLLRRERVPSRRQGFLSVYLPK